MRTFINRQTLRQDATAGVVLGVESVPDGLALGVLAGVNPLAGLYGYLYGTVGGALFSSTSVLTVQVTGAMAIIVADAGLDSHDDPARALYTLSVMAGVIMVIAGIMRAGVLLRFVPRAVMVGFISGVGINTILGQLGNFTGYDAEGGNRIVRTLNLMVNFWEVHLPTLVVGMVTLVLIVVLQRTRIGAMGLVVAVVVGSVLALWFDSRGHEIAAVRDVSTLPDSLPLPILPAFGDMFDLLVPAFALAFVGLVQGAGVTSAFPNANGTPSNASRDFMGQGAGSILSGLFRGMPTGGSMSATALVVAAGGRTRVAPLVSGIVMAIVIVVFGEMVGYVSFPALAALLIVIGYSTVRIPEIQSVLKTGTLQATVLVVTFGLTMLMPVQYAVVAGVALAVVLFVVEQSNKVVIKRLEIDEEGHRRETDMPATVGAGEVVILQPYGSLFFGSANVFANQLPRVTGETRNSVVIMRLRGIDDLGVSMSNVLARYAQELAGANSRLILNGGDILRRQIASNGTLDVVGRENYYLGNEWHGRTLKRAYDDATRWIAERESDAGDTVTPAAPDAPP